MCGGHKSLALTGSRCSIPSPSAAAAHARVHRPEFPRLPHGSALCRCLAALRPPAPHHPCWLSWYILFSCSLLALAPPPRPTVAFLPFFQVFTWVKEGLSTLEARLVPALFLGRTSTADSAGPGARPQGETSHGPPAASVFGGSTLEEERSGLRPPPGTGKERREKWTRRLPQLGMDQGL